MKTDDLLYELMEEVTGTEADKLDINLSALEESKKQWKTKKSVFKRQKQLTLDKIHEQIQKEQKPHHIHFRVHRVIPLAAVMIMIFGMVVAAKEQDWDIKMADMLGLSSVMEELDGGYVKIGVSDTSDGVKLTASQAIGDQNSQWIQFDTNIPWEVGEDGYYHFENITQNYWDKKGRPICYGGEFYSFNNDGYVSFISYNMNAEKINRAKVEVFVDQLYAHQDEKDEQGTLVSRGKWKLSWTNCYPANTITRHPYEKVTLKGNDGTEFNCIIRKIEISPVSMRLEAWKNPLAGSTDTCYLEVDSITMKDGTTMTCSMSSGGSHNNWNLDSFLSFEDIGQININDVDYIMIGNEKIEMNP